MNLLRNRKKAFSFAFAGLREAIKKEIPLKVEVIFGVLVILCGLHFSITKTEWLAVLICIGAVITAEMFNTTIEKICDIVMPEKDDRVRYIKDVSAAAVLITCITTVAIGLIVFIPYFFAD